MRNKRKWCYIFSTLILLIVISCNNESSEISGKTHFYNEFVKYIYELNEAKKTVNYKFENNSLFIIVDINCLSCVSIDNLYSIEDFYTGLNENQRARTLIVFVGKIKSRKNEIETIIKKCNGIEDTENLAFQYEMNFSKILLVQTSNGKLFEFKDKAPIKLTDLNI
jgi:hypothetical protein